MPDVQAIAARRAATAEANKSANAATIGAAAQHLRHQDKFCRLIEAGNFTLSDDQAQEAVRGAAQAIRDGGRMPRFEAAERIATTDDRAFVVAIVREALDSGDAATELGQHWNGAKIGGSLRDAASWLYDQVAFGHWKEAPPADKAKNAATRKGKSRRRKGSKFSKAERNELEEKARRFLRMIPKATRPKVAQHLGVSDGTVSGLDAWQARNKETAKVGTNLPSEKKIGLAIAQEQHTHSRRYDDRESKEQRDEAIDAEEERLAEIKRLAAEANAEDRADNRRRIGRSR